jgi:uncharacterized membrane protein
MTKRFFVTIAIVAGLCALATLRPAPALADFQICNESGEHVSVAIAYHDVDAGNWVSRGWWNLNDGECKTPVGGNLRDEYYYLYGDGDQHYWKGSYSFCVDNSDAFTLNQADTTCSYDMESFFEVDTGDADSYTYTFR